MSSVSERVAALSAEQRAQLDARLAASAQAVSAEPVAVIGIGCRFPGGADSPAALWRLLVEGRDAVRVGPPGRWDLDAFYDEEPGTPGRTNSRWAGYLDDIEGFDAEFFGIPPREAAAMDPQHRLLLEVTWEALEHSGLPPLELAGSRTGVFAGLCYTDYAQRMTGRYAELDAYTGTGNAHSTAVGRISYLLGLTGPSIAVDTACSSSLVAIHLACQSLRTRECDLALAGGSGVLVRPELMIIGSWWGMLSPTGRCRSFDARADGFVRSEGAAVVALKRLTDAVRDGDRVLAVVRGSAVNQDGRSHGLTAPSVSAQRAVLRTAVQVAGADPTHVGLVECHGSGTPLGDPIEFQALADVYGKGPYGCALGAVKSNLGHTEAAAGVAGFIKAVLCVDEGVIPPNLHFTTWNPDIAADRGRLFVPTEVTPWPVPERPRWAAVSSFGMGGTNAHVVLEQAPIRNDGAPTRRSRTNVFVLSAGSSAGLHLAAGRLADWLRASPDASMSDVAYTLATRRSHHPARLAVVAREHGELITRLAAFAGGEPDQWTQSGAARAATARSPVWVFSGHGSQRPDMCRRLLDADPAFAAAIDEVEPLIAAEAGFSVREVLRAASPTPELDTVGTVQPTLFATQVALAAAWRARGVEPAAVIGQSMGEVAAAVVCGALSLADGVRVICQRSRLMSRVAGAGAMVYVDLPSDQVESELAAAGSPDVTVAVVASPHSTIVAGATAQLDRLVASWDRRGVATRRIAIDVASHSPQVDPILDELSESLEGLTPMQPTVDFYSTVTADARAPLLADGRYWRANLRQPVRLADALAAAAADGHRTFVEISPHPVLLHAVSETLAQTPDKVLALPTLTRERETPEAIDAQLAALYCAGVPIDWTRHHRGGALVDLPTMAWNRQRHWEDQPPPHPDDAIGGRDTHPLLGVHVSVPGGDGQHVWQADIGTATLPWLADHPGAAFCEMALAAAGAFFEGPEVAVVDLRFERSLAVAEHTVVSTVVTPLSPGRALLEIGGDGDGGEWTRYAVAEVRSEPDRDTPPAVDADELTASGSSVRAEVRIPGAARASASRTRLHPCLLDSCLQALAAVRAGEPLAPTAVGTLRVFGDTTRGVTCVARLEPGDDDSATGHVLLLAADGTVLASVDDVRLARTETVGPMLHEITWEPVGLGDPAATTGDWVVLGEECELVDRVRDALGASSTMVASARGVVVVAGCTARPDVAPPALARAELLRLITVITELGQAIDPPRLWMVTRGAQQVRPEDDVALDQAALRGLARVAMFEHAELRPTVVDLDPAERDAAALAARLVSELLADRAEDEVAWRGDTRLVARLTRSPLTDDAGRRRPRRAVRYGRDGFALRIGRPGDLDTLDLAVRPRRAPDEGEVEIQVLAAALNFRDVLAALGAYPGLDESGLGSDCAGVVTAVGPGVETPCVGDRVFGLAEGAFGSFAIAPTRTVAPVPEGMGLVEASALPAAYLTAWYALRHVARLAAGERVLIHAASGGVGLAATAVATAHGAEVLATAGSPRKRAYLHEQGIAHVMDSRSLDFREQVMRATGGAGVDVILNSLSGRALRAGLEALAVGGRFVELGKRDIHGDSKIGMLPFRRNITLSSVDLDLFARTRPDAVAAVLREVVTELDAGRLPALPYRAMPLTDAVEAFRTMAAAKHIGKLVLTVPEHGCVDAVVPAQPAPLVRSDGAYVVTGGLGGLGMLVAGWLADGKAGRIVLNGRTAPSADTEAQLARLRGDGASIEVVLGDIAEPAVAERLVAAATEGGLALRGVVHAAGTFAEAPVANLDADRVDLVWRPKVDGAWRLHEATAGHELDWFVLFSSAAAMVGNIGHGNYSAANAWLDAFAGWRRRRGLPATSIGWGPWDRIGMAARVADRGRRTVGARDGIAALEALVRHDRVHTGVFYFDADDVLKELPAAVRSSFFAATPIARADFDDADRGDRGDRGDGGAFGAQLAAVEPGQRRSTLVDHLAAQIRTILGVDAASVEPQAQLANLGFDSLTALQLRNLIERDLALKIPATVVWTCPTLLAFADDLLERMDLPDDTPSTGPHRQPSAGPWFLRYEPRPNAAVRLFCFPYLGGAASGYRHWTAGLPSFVELHAVQLPGRETRAHEPHPTDLHQLADELADALAAEPDERPFACFGHSGGALLAFETARALRRRHGSAPVLLAVSARLPPEHPAWDARVRRLLADRPMDAIAIRARHLLDDPHLAAQARSAFEADAAMYASYRHRPEPALDCPISVFAGSEDPLYRVAELDGWRTHTSVGLVSRSYPGDHDFLRHRLADVLADLAEDLSRLSAYQD